MAKIKDAVTLTVITLVAGLLLGGVYELTKEPIAQQQIAANAEAYQAVCPEAVTFANTEELDAKVAGAAKLLEDSGLELGNVVLEDALEAYDQSGSLAGLVIKTTSKDGYGGNISIVVGVAGDGTVTGIDYLEINETAGLGMKAAEAGFKSQFQDKNVDSFEVTKQEAASENQIEALSGATFTSNAVTNAVNAANYFARNSALAQ